MKLEGNQSHMPKEQKCPLGAQRPPKTDSKSLVEGSAVLSDFSNFSLWFLGVPIKSSRLTNWIPVTWVSVDIVENGLIIEKTIPWFRGPRIYVIGQSFM